MARELIIDGQKVEPDPSRTLLEVAQELGIHIPTLCAHKALTPYGACRICVVEVIWKGRSSLRTACTFPAWEGEVRTNSEKVRKARKLLLELILAEAPESKEIQELAEGYGAEKGKYRVSRAGIDNKCIMCGLCVRVCKEVMKIGAIGFKNRGNKREIAIPFEKYSDVCSTCGACAYFCPTDAIKLEDITDKKITPVISEFEQGLVRRPVIYTPFPQAVPNIPVIDKENCMYFKNNACKICDTVCEPDAVRFDQEDELIEEQVGTIVVATGYGLYPIENIGEYGAGKYEDVINGLQFERLLSASGPTEGEIRRPSDNKIPKRIAFISCVGSRDAEHHLPYCSKICCMYMVKHALLYKEHVPDGEAIIFSIDVRTAGKDYEEFYNRAKEEGKILYIRGKPARILKEGDELVVWSIDTLTGRQIRLKCDMAVLAMAIVPSTGAFDLAKLLRIQTNSHGFFTEAHPKLRPVETNTGGILLAGCAQAPKDIPDVVAQASGAAAKALDLLSSDKLHHLPIIATVNEDLCSGCRICISICPYEAREIDEEKNIATVNEILCEGCGACISACPSGASQQKNFTDGQINNMIKTILDELQNKKKDNLT